MKSTLKKFLSITLVVSMLMSLCTFVFATGDADADAMAEQKAAQINLKNGKPVYYTWDAENGKFDETPSDDPVVTNSDKDTKVWLEKTIAPTGTENEFNITLDVWTKDVEINKSVSAPAAVTLVIDLSSSMYSCSKCSYTATGSNNSHRVDGKKNNGFCDGVDRLVAAKEAAKDFVKTYAGWNATTKTYDDPGAARWISVAWFGTSAGITQQWFDLRGDGSNIAKNVDTICTAISGIQHPSRTQYTNTSGGLKQAETLLINDKVKDLKSKFVILLTDGAPYGDQDAGAVGHSGNITERTEYAKRSDYDGYYDFTDASGRHAGYYDRISEVGRSGWVVGQKEGYDYGARRAARIRGTGADQLNTALYSIAFGLETSYPTEWLKDISDKSYVAKQANQLTIAFGNVVSSIESAVQPWVVTDPMGEYITCTKTFDEKSPASLNDDGALKWDLQKAAGTPEDDGRTHYSETYRIKLDVASAIADNKDLSEFLTNGRTYLEYSLPVTETEGDVETTYYVDDAGHKMTGETTLTKDFKVPAVKGYKADLSFIKVNAAGDKLDGATFQLASVRQSADQTPAWKQTISQSTYGKFAFAPMPSGETYTLTETKAPDRYLKVAPITIEVKYGQIYKDGTLVGKDMKIVDPESTSVTFTKTWAGDTVADRPTSIWVALLKNGDKIDAKEMKPDTNGKWACTFDNLNKTDSDGKDFLYTVKEMTGENGTMLNAGDKLYDKYTVAYGDDGKSIINYIQSSNVTVKVIKEWIKLAEATPEVTVTLLANGTAVKDGTVKLTAPEYTHTFTGLDKYNDRGAEIVYSVSEAAVTGYEAVGETTLTVGSSGEITFKNKIKQTETSISVEKKWVGTASDAVSVQLYKNDVEDSYPVELNKENEWKHTFDKLDTYTITETSATLNTYKVREVGESNGVITIDNTKYAVAYADSAATVITNTELTNITVEKVWVEESGEAVSHDEAQVKLSGGGTEMTATLENGTYTFTDLPKYAMVEGVPNEIEYSITEINCPDGYTPSVEFNNGSYTFTLTNTKSGETSVTVNKTWKHPAGTAEQTAEFTLYRYKLDENGTRLGEKELVDMEGNPATIKGDGSYTFNKLTKYYEYIKKVEKEPEIEEPGAYSENPEGGEEPGNKEPEYIEIPAVGEYEYVVEETGCPADYQLTDSNHTGNTWSFTNTIKPGSASVSVYKYWDVPSDKMPTATFKVYAGGEAEVNYRDSISISWQQTSGTLSGLEKYDAQGQLITYVVVEQPLEGFSSAPAEAVEGYNYSFKNTFDDRGINLDVSKVWIDDATPATRPNVTLTLKQDGNDYATVTFAYKDGAVCATINDVDATDVSVSEDGKTYSVKLENVVLYEKINGSWVKHRYTIDESNVPASYIKTVDNEHLTVYNKHITPVVITKIWLDAGDTTRPEIKLTLTGSNDYGYEKSYEITVTPTSTTMGTLSVDGNQWKVTISGNDLPEYDENGHKITYTVAENEAALEGTGYELDSTNGLVITNRIEQVKIDVDGEKLWKNLPEDEGFQLPEKVKVELYNGGEKAIGTQIVKPDDDDIWYYKFEDLPKYEFVKDDENKKIIAVKPITYTVKEADVNDGIFKFKTDLYEVSYDENGNIINTYKETLVYRYDVTCYYVHKDWKGNVISSAIEESELIYGSENQTITMDPNGDTATYNGKTYKFDESFNDVDDAKNNLSVTLEKDATQETYHIVIHYILTDPTPYYPPVRPKPPVTPPEDIDEPDVPLAGDPEIEDLGDDDVPLAGLPGDELEDLEEEEVPLAAVPKTSDMALFWLASSALSGIGLGALNLKKREDEDEQ